MAVLVNKKIGLSSKIKNFVYIQQIIKRFLEIIVLANGALFHLIINAKKISTKTNKIVKTGSS
jgi:hypothetical protein